MLNFKQYCHKSLIFFPSLTTAMWCKVVPGNNREKKKEKKKKTLI